MSLALVIVFATVIFGSLQAQQCSEAQFSVKNNGQEYLTINSPTEVKTCGGVNICDQISQGKQSLALSAAGEISITNGNSIQLPDNSATNEIQSLSLDAGHLSISGSNAVDLPDISPTNELQTLSVAGRNLSISNGNSIDLVSAVTNKLETEWVPVSVVPSKTGFGADAWYPKASVMRSGKMVFMRGWLNILADITSDTVLFIPDVRFNTENWRMIMVYGESSAGASPVFMQVTLSNGFTYISLRWGTLKAGSMLSFDGVSYSVDTTTTL